MKRKPKKKMCPFYQNGNICTNFRNGKNCCYNYKDCPIVKKAKTLLK